MNVTRIDIFLLVMLALLLQLFYEITINISYTILAATITFASAHAVIATGLLISAIIGVLTGVQKVCEGYFSHQEPDREAAANGASVSLLLSCFLYTTYIIASRVYGF